MKNQIFNQIFISQLIVFLTVSVSLAQSPCGTAFTGFDPCSAEPLSMATSCAGVQEEFRTNACSGINPTSSSCGLAAGTEIVWGSFYVSVADVVTITWTASNSRNIRLGLYQYTDVCTMTGETEIACVNTGGNGVDETISTFLPTGQYFICGESTGNLSAASQICIHSPNVPPAVVASDCSIGVDVCTDLNFMIDPNGEGVNTSEIPTSGSMGNPLFDGFSTFNPWGTINMGCLQIDESNSTWMFVNISGSGDLEFKFGAGGAQAGFYDWIMYPANTGCGDVSANIVGPARCNWNLVDYGGTGLVTVVPAGGDTGNYEPPLPVLAGEVYLICFSNYSSVQTQVPLEFGGTATVSCTPLPVELINFTGFENGREVELNWRTSTENNNDYFSIERSTDGQNYTSIGQVLGMGTSTQQTDYEFIDENPISGSVNYYRLKQVDFNGNYKHSGVIPVSVSLSKDKRLFPNPATDFVVLNVADFNVQSASVIVKNLLGEELDQRTILQGQTEIILNVNKYKPGTYLVQVWSEENLVFNDRLIVE